VLASAVSEVVGDGLIAIDGANRPNVIYGRSGVAPALIHAVRSTGWQTSLVDSGALVQGLSIFVDDAGDYHVAYVDAVSRELRYVRHSASGWSVPVVVAGSVRGPLTPVALHGDGGGAQHVAFGSGADVMYATSSTGTWSLELATTATASRLGISHDGAPQIVVLDPIAGRLSEATRGAQGWFVPFNTPAADWLAARTTDDGRFHVVHDVGAQLMRTTRETSGSWASTMLDTVGAAGGNAGTNVDAAGALIYAYTRFANPGLELVYRWDDGGQARTVVVRTVANAAGGAVRPSLTLDNAGLPHFVYWFGGSLYYGH